jgi:hypothetical protein
MRALTGRRGATATLSGQSGGSPGGSPFPSQSPAWPGSPRARAGSVLHGEVHSQQRGAPKSSGLSFVSGDQIAALYQPIA